MRMSQRALSIVGFIMGLLLLPLPVYGQTFQIDTKNGDVIIGELRGSIKIAPAIGGDLTVPASQIVSIDGNRFTFKNRMRITGKINQERLEVQTEYGPQLVPVAEIAEIRLAQPAGGASQSPQQKREHD